MQASGIGIIPGSGGIFFTFIWMFSAFFITIPLSSIPHTILRISAAGQKAGALAAS
jgi:hypothetical protein